MGVCQHNKGIIDYTVDSTVILQLQREYIIPPATWDKKAQNTQQTPYRTN